MEGKLRWLLFSVKRRSLDATLKRDFDGSAVSKRVHGINDQKHSKRKAKGEIREFSQTRAISLCVEASYCQSLA